MREFAMAALPWILMGIGVAVAVVKLNKDEEK